MIGKLQKIKLVICFIICCFSAFSSADQKVSFDTLLREMIDLDRLVEFPDPYYKTVQFSSYDRSTGKVNGSSWFNNLDGFGGEPVPAFEDVIAPPDKDGIGTYLVCDVNGPGAIVRMWTAMIPGKIRMYLDSSKSAVYEGDAGDFFKYPYKLFADDLNISLLDKCFTQRDASYFPVPFAKRCRIEWTGNIKDIHFYHIQIRCYEPGTKVLSFTAEQLEKSFALIQEVSNVLNEPDEQYNFSSGGDKLHESVSIKSKENKKIIDINGNKVIKELKIRLQAEDIAAALRQTVMTIKFDDSVIPQVQSPVGDFFGSGPGINPYKSLPFTVKSDGTMVCRLPMPFNSNAKIYFRNHGRQVVNCKVEVLSDKNNYNENALLFNALWRADHHLISNDPVVDLPFLVVRGTGRFIGSAIMLFNSCDVPIGAGGSWWGEGDEKVFVDEDKYPSIFGTGTEDYFNYAWGMNDIFAYPYCNQSRNDGPANRGFVANARFQIIDDLPFKDFFAFYMELLHHTRNENFSYARISYFYAQPDRLTDHVEITHAQARMPQVSESWTPILSGLGLAKGYQFYQVEQMIDSLEDNRLAFEHDPIWAGGKLVVFNPEKKGDKLCISIKIPEDGNYELKVTHAVMPGSGAYSAALDGNSISVNGTNLIQLDSPFRKMSRTIELGSYELKKGIHLLEIKSESGTENNKIGLDFLWIKKL
ncbi:hypothetical protein SMSP2_01961 [Limihaloglobus sulfuriphilus]|uniref:DUF2961 domain-containing protein n=1 Tax=Limihaloglobus sulfuriphilus TaxID=1851148 RepID=A0A1Q2MFW3_9BACT|nr:DUF2961 domain-containing protein [Limihaloglobus sulfuriphilus]AQQ71585.1 hypothetical protein SMSP2_01961 [Limihaloglobus sulfuriphilus]